MIEELKCNRHYASIEDAKRGDGITIPPTTSEIVDKINEIIGRFNQLEDELKNLMSPIKEDVV